MAHDPKILHVDDDTDILEIALLALETVGAMSVHQCTSGEAAIKCALKVNPDLFLLDVMMPNMTGLQTLENLRALTQFNNTPAIFMTAKAQPHQIDYYHEAGAFAVISKPFDPLTLADQIRKIYGRWQEQYSKTNSGALEIPHQFYELKKRNDTGEKNLSLRRPRRGNPPISNLEAD